MKKIILLFALATLMTSNGFSQNNMVVFSQGQKFSVILNGIKQNSTPETNVKITGLIQPSYKLKIIFDDKKPDLDKTVYLMDGGEPVKGYEFTFSISLKNGEYKVKQESFALINQAPPAPEQRVVAYTTTPAPEVTATAATTTTTTTTTTGVPAENISMGINVAGMAMNMKVTINEGTTSANTSTHTETTQTTTTVNSSAPQQVQPQAYVLAGYNGPAGCLNPMPQSEFSKVAQSISSKSFEESKITIAKQVIKDNCLLSSQVKEIMLLFSFEETRLDLAKFAYGNTYDIGNYYRLNDAFTFESSIDELNEFIESTKK
jgi:hypothetical protein